MTHGQTGKPLAQHTVSVIGDITPEVPTQNLSNMREKITPLNICIFILSKKQKRFF